MRMLFASSPQDLMRMCFFGLRDHCRGEQQRTKHVGMAETFAGSFDRYALMSAFEAWVHVVAQQKRAARLQEQRARSKQYLFAMVEASDAALLKTCLHAFRDEWQHARQER